MSEKIIPDGYKVEVVVKGLDGCPDELREIAVELEAKAAPAVPDTHISVQEAWEAAGGNPGIKASKADLIIALKTLDTVCDEADAAPAVPQGEPVAWRVSSKDEPELGFWLDEEGPGDDDMGLHYEPLYTAAPSQEPVQEVTLTDEAVNAAAKVLAERFDYPWEHMPDQGRENMRKNVRNVIAALRKKEQTK